MTQIFADFRRFLNKKLRPSAFYQRLSAFYQPLLNSYAGFNKTPSESIELACYSVKK
jgi:hypothetical protein